MLVVKSRQRSLVRFALTYEMSDDMDKNFRSCMQIEFGSSKQILKIEFQVLPPFFSPKKIEICDNQGDALPSSFEK